MSTQVNLKDWIGHTETVADTVTATPVAALSAALDWPSARPPAGTPLPALWHWLYFLPLAQQSEIGADGHPQRGGKDAKTDGGYSSCQLAGINRPR